MKRERPQLLPSITIEKQTHCGKIYVTVTIEPTGLPFELFARFGKAGHCGAAVVDGVTKLTSYALRSGMEPEEAIKAMAGIGCVYGKNTCMNAMAEALQEVLGETVEVSVTQSAPHVKTKGPE